MNLPALLLLRALHTHEVRQRARDIARNTPARDRYCVSCSLVPSGSGNETTRIYLRAKGLARLSYLVWASLARERCL